MGLIGGVRSWVVLGRGGEGVFRFRVRMCGCISVDVCL